MFKVIVYMGFGDGRDGGTWSTRCIEGEVYSVGCGWIGWRRRFG